MNTVYTLATENKDMTSSWNEFVMNHPESSFYHRAEWRDIITRAFDLRSFYLYTTDANGTVDGILPMVLSKSRLFGTYLTSIPFFNYGGILANNRETAQALFDAAAKVAEREHASYVELRHRNPVLTGVPTKTHKVRMILELKKDPAALWDGFKSKLRSQIKRAQREDMTARIGGQELVDDFYAVFSTNMRDLGTPVWTKKLFQNILDTFPGQAKICMIYYKNQPVAAGFLHGFKEVLEIPSASSLKKYNNVSPNMLLYWNVLEFACREGYLYFDFGRSSPDSGTYRFKEQWGSVPETLHWQYWLAGGQELPQINPQNPKYRLAIALWQKLPLPVANIVGPLLSRNLP